MTTVIGGSSPSITFSDSTTQSTAALPLTGGSVSADITVHGLTVGQGAGSVSTNTAVGASALALNSTGSVNTAVGANSMAIGVVTGTYNSGFGFGSLYSVTSGGANSAIGASALQYTTTGSNNTGVGTQSLYNNTTASYNTAVGYQAGYSNVLGGANTFIGNSAGFYFVSGSAVNTFNTFIGNGSGSQITSGIKNTVLGSYSGNQGGLDIRGSNNKIVLSDGDGNPLAACGVYPSGAGTYASAPNGWTLGIGGTSATYDGVMWLNGAAYTGFGPCLVGKYNGSVGWAIGSYSYVVSGTNYNYLALQAGTSGGQYMVAGATSWSTISDETRKVIIEDITDGLNKVSTLRTVIGRLKTDDNIVRRPYLIAQDVQKVLPESVSESEDKEGPVLGLSYTEVIPLLVAAIKELNTLVTSQATEIAALKAKVGI